MHKESQGNSLVCKNCDETLDVDQNLEDHIVKFHQQIEKLNCMPIQVHQMNERFQVHEVINGEMRAMMESVIHTQNEIKQELFLIRNSQFVQPNSTNLPKKKNNSTFLLKISLLSLDSITVTNCLNKSFGIYFWNKNKHYIC